MNEKKSLKQRLDDFWGISENHSSFRVEIIAGIATFLAMAYILTVNPNQILYDSTNDPRWSSLFIATAFGAIIGTLLMSLYAKMPFAQASGMGLNSALGSVIGGGIGLYGYVHEYSLANALLLVLISGIIFLLLSIIPIGKKKESGKWITLREKIFDGMPAAVRNAIPIGIGFFIAFIGLQNAKIINTNPYTLVSFVDLTKIFSGSLKDPNSGELYEYTYALVALVGFTAICIFSHFKVKGAVIYGILIATLVALPLQVTNVTILSGKANGITWKFWVNFETYFSSGGVFFSALTDGWNFPADSVMTSVMLVITFCMIDMFDTMGTVVGCAVNANLIDEEGKPKRYNKIMIADSVATCTGALLGTSTVTTFVESGTGIAAGGRTGFSSFVTAILFFASIFLLPIFAFIPSAAAASALIYVGVLMIKNVRNIDFSSIKNSAPAFLTILMMPLTYSITAGIGIGIISYVVISIFCYLIEKILYLLKKGENPSWDISVVALIVCLLFAIYFLVPTVL